MTIVTPCLTVDIIVASRFNPEKVVLIERKNAPFGWALPGGFVDIGESVESAAVREAKEEISLDVALIKLLGVYSDPTRDPRHHNVSCTFIARCEELIPVAADDAKNVMIFDCTNPVEIDLAFDHAKIIADYTAMLSNGDFIYT